MSPSRPTSGVQVLDRTFRILDALAAARQGVALRDLAASLDLPKPTLHRLLAALIEHGYVRRNVRERRYELGLRAVELGRMALAGLDLRSCSRRYLDDLVLRSAESARLAVLDGSEVVYIDGADAPTNLHPTNTVGHRVPAHATAMGKALLASLDGRALTSFLERPLRSMTRWTRTDPLVLRDELATVLRRGFAVEREEYEEGLACVAAVIRNHNGAIEGAIGLAGPSQRMPPDRIARELGPLIAISALSVSRDLGWVPPESSFAEIEEAAERARTAVSRLLSTDTNQGWRNPTMKRSQVYGAAIGAALLVSSGPLLAADMRYAHSNAPTYPYHIAGEAFAKELSAKTNRALVVKVFPQGQLGQERDVLEGIQLGTIDFQATSLGVAGNEIPAINVLNLPFIFSGPEHFMKVMNGPIGEELMTLARKEGDRINVKVLGIAGPMFRIPMNNVRAIKTVADFKGLRIRTMEVPLHRDTYIALGASPIPLPFGDVYTALQTGVVDGNENGASALLLNRFNEVQKHVSTLPVVSNGGVLLMSGVSFGRLSADQQKIVMDASAVWVKSMNDESVRQEDDAIAKMEKAGVTVTRVTDVSPFIEATRSVYDKNLASLPQTHKDLVRKIIESQR